MSWRKLRPLVEELRGHDEEVERIYYDQWLARNVEDYDSPPPAHERT